MIRKNLILALMALAVLSACKKSDLADAYGNFEAEEVIVSAKANGQILSFKLNEGDHVTPNRIVGYIDTALLAINKQQLLAQKRSIESNVINIDKEIKVLQTQKESVLTEYSRIQKLLKQKAATVQTADKLKGQLDVIDAKIDAAKARKINIAAQIDVLNQQQKQIDLQIKNSLIENPIDGKVIVKYAEENEMAAMGKPLYKIADMNNMILRAYFSENQLADLQIGSKVQVALDHGDSEKIYDGEISWISDEAEFTPKIIQTKEERVNMVYAVKIRVKNDGSIKIGMPAEVNLETAKK